MVMELTQSVMAACATVGAGNGLPHIELVHNTTDGNMLMVLEECLEHCRSFRFAVAFITFDGLAAIRERLEQLRGRGVRGSILTTDYMYVTDPRALTQIAQQFENIDLRIYITAPGGQTPPLLGGFHTKGYIFEYEDDSGRYNIIIGSSNLTARALKDNREWNVRVTSGGGHTLVREVLTAWEALWKRDNVAPYQEYIDAYATEYARQHRQRAAAEMEDRAPGAALVPNAMQQDFIGELGRLLREGERRALLISATGTGKTYAAAFAARELLLGPGHRLLFIVHREQIARQAQRSFRRVLGGGWTLGYLTGSQKDTGADLIFATMQTLSKPAVMEGLARDAFYAIIIDEAHHVGAESYQRITGYFEPRLWLGMSASPDRMDDFDVYAAFDHNIACEIRLQHALEYDLLCPFHYYGIADFRVGERQADLRDFAYLISQERVRYILEKIRFYSHPGERVHGLIFCSTNQEAAELSQQINALGEFRTVHLSGANTQAEREMAITALESSDPDEALDYIVTVDIFNEGVDIPCVNQVVLLRPTQSPVIFVQQLGRGLRRHADKTCVVIIDFIGNHTNNYMIPMALCGDRSYDRERLRSFVLEGGRVIPGASSVSFDEISTRRIIESIDTANFSLISLLRENYCNLRHKLGRIPRLADFEAHGSMAVECIFRHRGLRSYHGFLSRYEADYKVRFTEHEEHCLAFISQQLANGRRDDELLVVEEILRGTRGDLYAALEVRTGRALHEHERVYLHHFLSNQFLVGTGRHAYPGVSLVRLHHGGLEAEPGFVALLDNPEFRVQVEELIAYGLHRFAQRYRAHGEGHYLVLNERYSYYDVCRCLSWEQAMVPQNMGGYVYDAATRTMPIFVNYNKGEGTQARTRYEDRFVDRQTMSWVSKNRRTLHSPDIQTILNCTQQGVGLHLFVRRSGSPRHEKERKGGGKVRDNLEFYYLGPVTPDPAVAAQTISLRDEEHHQELSAVRLQLQLRQPVRPDIYDYLTLR